MVKLRLLAALFLFALPLHGQSSQPPSPGAGKEHSQNRNTQGKDDQPKTHTNLQGTQASPLWVNVNCPGCAKPDAANGTGEAKRKPSERRSDPNWWIVCLTGVLAFIAAIQAGLFIRQLRMLRESMADSKKAADAAGKAADAAQRSADIASDTDREWIITNAAFSSDWPDITGKRCSNQKPDDPAS